MVFYYISEQGAEDREYAKRMNNEIVGMRSRQAAKAAKYAKFLFDS